MTLLLPFPRPILPSPKGGRVHPKIAIAPSSLRVLSQLPRPSCSVSQHPPPWHASSCQIPRPAFDFRLSRSFRLSQKAFRSFPIDSSFSPEDEGIRSRRLDFFEFITSERVKVVSMLGLALALCTADRAVMSVVIVPFSITHGWSKSFAGVVQVIDLV
ncbi:hypothetical protein ACLOJK_012482 [Asimina triloba]